MEMFLNMDVWKFELQTNVRSHTPKVNTVRCTLRRTKIKAEVSKLKNYTKHVKHNLSLNGVFSFGNMFNNILN